MNIMIEYANLMPKKNYVLNAKIIYIYINKWNKINSNTTGILVSQQFYNIVHVYINKKFTN